MIAKRPVLVAIGRARFPARQSASEWKPQRRRPVLEHLDDLLPGEVQVRRRAAGDEGVVDDDGRLLAEVADVPAAGRGRVAQDVLERVRRRAHVEVRAHEARAVLVVVLDAVAGDVLAGDDALAVLQVASERERGDPVALRGDRLVGAGSRGSGRGRAGCSRGRRSGRCRRR